MTYEQALARLAELGPELRPALRTGNAPAPRKWSLDHIRTLLSALGDPQNRFRSVLIAGTNGKGSTAATLASILNAAGHRTGLYTSPHLQRVNERVRISSGARLAEISDEDFGRLFGLVDAAAATLVRDGALPHAPSFFELLTALAFCFFAEQQIEIAVLEVGLGGRLDATNVVEPIVSVITDIGLDHTEFLGNTIAAIATEKAGILRDNGILITLAQHPEANAAIGEVAVAKNVRGVDAARCLPPQTRQPASIDVNACDTGLARNRYSLSIDGKILHVDSPLAGRHQQRNIALALATAFELRARHDFKIPDDTIERGVRETDWPGRLEWIPAQSGRAALLLDVAHNPAGGWALRSALSQLTDARPRTLIFSCLADKPAGEMEQILFPLFDATSGDPDRGRDHIILTHIANPRAATLEDLIAAARSLDVAVQTASDVSSAFALAEEITPRDGIIVATGSIFLVSELRRLALSTAAERLPALQTTST